MKALFASAGRGALTTAALLAAMTAPGLAHAAAAAAAATDTTTAEVGELVVTGSHIRTDNFTSPVPLASVSSEQVKNSGAALLGDVLKDLPQIDSSSNNQNTSSTLFLAGQSRIDIRGLGPSRTLVLVDSRRHVASDASSPAVDTNMIPSMMVDRVEVITGAASAVYGSDAIAGVVNFIMKKKFDGLQLDAQTGTSQHHDGEEFKLGFLAGHSFLGDRLHLVIGGEVARQEPIGAGDRAFTYPGIRRNTLANPQTIIPNSRSTTTPYGTLELKSGVAGTAIAVTEDVRNRQNIVRLSPECSPTTVLPTCQDESLYYSTILNALRGDVKRGAVRGYAEYEVTDQIKVFNEFTFARTHGFGFFQPTFSQTTGAGTLPANIFGDNAYLNGPGANAAALRGFWTQPVAAGGPGLTLTSASKAGLGRFWTEFGGRNVASNRDSYRYVAGAEGDIAFHNLHWDASGEYGEVRGVTISYGVANINKTLASLDAVNDGGAIKCRINASTDLYTAATAPTPGQVGTLNTANDDAACAPWDFLNGPSAAAVAYGNGQSSTSSRVREYVLTTGLTGDVIQLPAGPLAFAVGAEYRHEYSAFVQDAIGASGALFLNAIGTRAGQFDVREGYGELNVPVFRDMPFTKNLSFNFAGRLSNYSTVHNTKTWRIAGDWSPFEDVKFRAAIGTAVRAPNIVELFSPQSVNFTTAASDPCDSSVFAGATAAQKAFRSVTCAAAIAGYNSATFVSNFGGGRASLKLLQGGNPHLGPETAKTKQFGVVIEPRFLPHFQISWDYYDYNVTNYITTLPIQTALNLCYDSALPIAANQFCNAITRDPTGAGTPGHVSTGVAGGVSDVQLTNANAAFLHVKGYDISVQYAFDISEVLKNSDDLGNIAIRVDANRQWDNILQASPLDTPFNFAGFITTQTPKWKGNATLQYTRDKFQISWNTHYIKSMSSTNSFTPAQLSPYFTGDYYSHDLRTSYKISDRYQVRGGILNVTNANPPLLPETYTGTGTAAQYDNRGRFFYVGATATF
jgi:iron complex outermembrane receptor protein